MLSVKIFISWCAWISVDTTGSSHAAIILGRQGLVLWLWSTCHFKPLFYIFGALIQAKREQHVLWQLTGSSAAENGHSYCIALDWNFQWCLRATTVSTVRRDGGFANKDGDGKALAPPQTVKLVRMAEVHRGVSGVCCRRSFAAVGSGQLEQTVVLLLWKGELWEGVPRDVSYCHAALAQRWCSTALLGWLAVCSYPSSHRSFSFSFLISRPPLPFPFMAPSLLLSFPTKLLPSWA